MSAAKANNNRDTYKATAITLIVFGILYLVDKLVHFSAIGLPWVMNKDNFLLYTAVIFLLFKHDKSVGLVLIGLWLILNFGLITALLGTMSAYLLPLALLALGAILYELLPQIVSGKENALWVHTAGSIPMNIWQGHVARYGVLYPMQTFSKQREVDFGQIPCFVESNSEEDVQLLKDIASALSEKVYEASSEQRKSLHLAAVFTCNFTNHMYVLAAELLKKYGLPFEAMLPLIDETARKVHELEPLAAQTGPAVRYDENVIDEHLRMLADEPQMLELYREISENIHRLAIR